MLYDFTKPEDIPQAVRGTFDMVVADPPFITRQVRDIRFQVDSLIYICCLNGRESPVVYQVFLSIKGMQATFFRWNNVKRKYHCFKQSVYAFTPSPVAEP